MTLWSINQADDWWAPSVIAHLIDSGVLVPVQRCKHGNYGKHAVVFAPEERRATKWDITWCDGGGADDPPVDGFCGNPDCKCRRIGGDDE